MKSHKTHPLSYSVYNSSTYLAFSFKFVSLKPIPNFVRGRIQNYRYFLHHKTIAHLETKYKVSISIKRAN